MNDDRCRTGAARLGLLTAAMIWAGAGAWAAEPLTLFVSPQGDDSWTGRIDSANPARTDGPLATLGHARDLVRRMRKSGQVEVPVTVLVRGGSYELAETLRFLPEDGGSAEAPVVYRAYPGERPILRGGRKITGFVAHRGQVMKAELAAQGLKGASFKELFCGGQRLPLARYPNFDPDNPYGGGWAFADGPLVPMYEDRPGEDGHTLHYKAEDRRTWSKPGEVEVFVFPRYNWWNNIIPIKTVDASTRTIRLAGEASYADPPRRPLLFPQCPRGARCAGRVVSRPGVRHALPLASRRAGRRERRRRADRGDPDRGRARDLPPDAPRVHPRMLHRRSRGAEPNDPTARSPAAPSGASATITTGP